ncbi:MAG: hypothetical protein F4003_10090 [Acidimicrobiaceae bacterium]|nr:hypothetical protein [Acidimicrobiaceae bacterium]MYC42632.1 hypothetical protein [Acidimicrobiaceae bacterium]
MEPNFINRTIWTGDNLDILRGINSATADLIYLDPPFNSNRNYAAPVGSKAAGAAFKDTWTLSDLDVAWAGYIADEHPAVAYLLSGAGMAHSAGMQSYLTMMAVRLLEMQRILKPTGSIYLHCDPTASHYLKQLMDAVFGRDQFRNEIVWCYSSGGASKKHFSRKHDVLLLYGRTRDCVHNVIRVAYATPGVEGRPGFHPEGKMLQDWWTDIGIISTTGSERAGYPTQKPLKLLERIITASSNENDVVLDPFAGCATACVAAEKLKRRWVGIDLFPKAAELVNERLRGEMGDLFHHGFVTTRTDIPQRTDIHTPKNYRQNRHVLYGEQEGRCAGCRTHFEFRHLEVDHVVPQSQGGSHHLKNLQLLCGHCNRVKGDRPMEYLLAQLPRVLA